MVTIIARPFLAAALVLLFAGNAAFADPKPAAESDYYRIVPIPVPDGIVLEVGALEMMPDGRLAVSTRRGDIYLIDGAFNDAPTPQNVKFTRWATGLHEVLGLAYNAKDGYLYAVQRGEVSRLKDADSDGLADLYETFCDDWGISGDYHEYPIGSKFDRDGNLYVTLCLTGSFTSEAPYRGWCLKITPDGNAVPFASGIRSPAGMGFNHEGDLFYCDNQGPWNGTSSLKHLKQGSFQGHPIGNKWYDLPAAREAMGPRPKDPLDNSRFHIEMDKIPQYVPPAVLLPHQKVGQSASGIVCDESGGKFGPFQRHLFVNDQHHSNLTRVVLEKVNGRYQGVAIPFLKGFASGNVPVTQAPDGSLFVGGTNRGWGSVGPRPFALERVVWTGKVPFELLDMKVTPDGFALAFAEPVDKATASDPKSYAMKTWTYLFRAEYGSPEVDPATPTITAAKVSEDGKTVRLTVQGRQIGSVHELTLPGVRSAGNARPLLHPVAWYTLWGVPEGVAK